MKRIFFLLGSFAMLIAVLTFIGSILEHATILEALATQFKFMCISAYSFFGYVVYWIMENSVYGGWKLEIFIDGQKLEFEEEELEVADMRRILKFKGGPWVALATGQIPKLRKNLKLERLLRECFESTGEINGEPRDSVTIEEHCLVLRLSENQIKRKSA